MNQEIKERLNILPEHLRNFIIAEGWRKISQKISDEFYFDEERCVLFENEIFLVLLCFEPRSDFAQNLVDVLRIDESTAKWVASEADREIFDQVEDELDIIEEQLTENESNSASSESLTETKNENILNKHESQQTVNGVGQSFEQIILNQAKAMQPAQAPENLPTQEEKPSDSAKAMPDKQEIHNYTPGNDPYREPIE